MDSTSETTSFRTFFLAWISLGGVIAFLWLVLLNIGFSESTTGSIMTVLPLVLFTLLVYTYIKNKVRFFKWFSYALIAIGIPGLLFIVTSPIFISVN